MCIHDHKPQLGTQQGHGILSKLPLQVFLLSKMTIFAFSSLPHSLPTTSYWLVPYTIVLF